MIYEGKNDYALKNRIYKMFCDNFFETQYKCVKRFNLPTTNGMKLENVPIANIKY